MNSFERQVLRLIGEDPDAPDVFTDDSAGLAQIRDSINDAVQEIIALSGGYTETYTVPLVKDRTFYRLELQSGSIGWVRTAWLSNQRHPLTQTSVLAMARQYPRWMRARGTPNAYMPIGVDTFALYPTPSGTSDVLELSLVILPDGYEHGDSWIPVEEGFEKAVIQYAVSEYWASRGDFNAALDAYGHYMGGLEGRIKHPGAKEATRQLSTMKDAGFVGRPDTDEISA